MSDLFEKTPAPHPEAAVERVGGRLMIATADDHLHYFVDGDAADQAAADDESVNEVGERIFELADGSRTVRQIAEALLEEFEVDLDTALTDTADFVQLLVDRQVLVYSTCASDTGGHSNRAP
jgi:hypothetical protein